MVLRARNPVQNQSVDKTYEDKLYDEINNIVSEF